MQTLPFGTHVKLVILYLLTKNLRTFSDLKIEFNIQDNNSRRRDPNATDLYQICFRANSMDVFCICNNRFF